MFSQSLSRTILFAVSAATLLVPAAQADSWARDGEARLDPAIATAIHDRASVALEPALDPALATAIRGHATVSPERVALDPAIRTALLERATPSPRPDDRPGMHGVGSLPLPDRAAPSDTFEWNVDGISAAAFAALLLALGLLIAVRRAHTRVTSA